jgi:hypothetical protein
VCQRQGPFYSPNRDFTMARIRRFKSVVFLTAGLAIGLAIGGTVAVGVYLGSQGDSAHQAALGELRLKASASHGAESFAMATGDIADGVEGLFCLDFLTGDLSCFVINPRTGAPGGIYGTNVTADLKAAGGGTGKKPAYVMVTGQFQARGGNYGGSQIAGSLVYVADANSGTVAVYGMPWSKQASTGNAAQGGKLVRLHAGKVRALEIRD